MRGIIQSVIDECAASILRAVMAEHKVGRQEFYTSRCRHHIAARVVAIHRLNEFGFEISQISKIVRMDRRNVVGWLRPDERVKRNAARARLVHQEPLNASEVRL